MLSPRESEETRGLTLVEYRQKLREEEGDKNGQDQEEEEEEGLENAIPRRVKRNLLLPPGWQQVLLFIGTFRQCRH